MKRLLAGLVALLLLPIAGCGDTIPNDSQTSETIKESEAPSSSMTEPSSDPSSDEQYKIEALINELTLRQQVEQLFMLSLKEYGEDPESAKPFLESTNPCGYILFSENISTVEETKSLVDTIVSLSDTTPFIGIDEEGGMISRLTSGKLPGYKNQPTASEIGATGNTDLAYNAGMNIGMTLKSIGVNLDFAPDADVLTNPNNTVIGTRSFGDDASLVADMAAAFQRGLHNAGIMCAPKHFPGHGGTLGDSHEGFVSVDYDEAHFAAVEYTPFIRTIGEGAAFILVGHITAPNADSSGLPATLSPYFVTEVLRNQLGFDGIIITDAMNMGAIADNYTSAESAVLAIKAGIDVILMPEDYLGAVQGILDAISTGEITKQRIRESLTRILQTKIKAGLIP